MLVQLLKSPDGPEWNISYTYGDDGRLLAVQSESSAGQSWSRIYQYGTDGRLRRMFVSDKEGRQRVAETYSYDEAGRKSKTVHVDREAQKPGVAYFWSAEGTDASFTVRGAATVASVCDENERLREMIFRDAEGGLLGRVDFVYDEAGHLVEESQRYSEQVLPAETMRELTPEQQGQLRQLFGAREEPNGRVHRYDERGYRVETISRLGGRVLHRQAFVCNEHGDRVAQTTEPGEITDEKPSEARMRYECDTHGNWVEQITECRNGAESDFTVTSIERRVLTYFDMR
jgi:hypothetical protein